MYFWRVSDVSDGTLRRITVPASGPQGINARLFGTPAGVRARLDACTRAGTGLLHCAARPARSAYPGGATVWGRQTVPAGVGATVWVESAHMGRIIEVFYRENPSLYS
jgi:hypothetical protein